MLKSVNSIPTSERLFKTKPCVAMCETGECKRLKCNFAHSAEELRHPLCAFGQLCNKFGCGFIHPFETVDTYRQRIGFVMPSFEKKEVIVSDPVEEVYEDEDDEDEDEDIDIVINILYEDIERKYPPTPKSLQPVKIDTNHEMSEIWAQIAVWNRRDIQWQ